MNLRIVILENKVLTDGTHKLRIAISHNSQTRYIPTRFTVPSPKNLKNGNVVGVSNAAYINQQLRTKLNNIYKVLDEIEDIEYYSCSQLVNYITNKDSKSHLKSISQIAEELLKHRTNVWAKSTIYIFKQGIKNFCEFAGNDFVLTTLTSSNVLDFQDFLKSKGYSETSIGIRMDSLRRVVKFAERHNLVKFKVFPFVDYKPAPKIARDVALSLTQLREFRDLPLTDKWEIYARDLFMLSFYLCGMNLMDILRLDLTKDSVKFIRQKTIKRRNPNETTEFTIQPEARKIIDRYIRNGKLQFGGYVTDNSIRHISTDHLIKLRNKINKDNLIFYSARKSFAQLANELLIKDSIIEYCIGDTPIASNRALSFYVNINKRMADAAIRRIFDAFASDKSLEQLIEDLEQ